MPLRGALGAGWEVARFARAGVAKTHWNDAKFGCVIKLFGGDIEPFSEIFTACIVPRNPAGMDFSTGGLTDDEDFSFGVYGDDGARFVRKMFGADGAVFDLLKEIHCLDLNLVYCKLPVCACKIGLIYKMLIWIAQTGSLRYTKFKNK